MRGQQVEQSKYLQCCRIAECQAVRGRGRSGEMHAEPHRYSMIRSVPAPGPEWDISQLLGSSLLFSSQTISYLLNLDTDTQSNSRLNMSGMNNGILSHLIFINIPPLLSPIWNVSLTDCMFARKVLILCILGIYWSIVFQEPAESNNNHSLAAQAAQEKKAAVR